MMLREMKSSRMGGMLSIDVSYYQFIVFLLANPGVPTQGYVPLRGMGTGWVLGTWGFIPVLPYPIYLHTCNPIC